MQNLEQERARFHSWAVMHRDENGLPYFISQREDGKYYDDFTNHAWAAWQAACPNGWQVVPTNLTNEMIKAFSIKTVGRWDDATEAEKLEVAEKLQAAFDAMLAAAPQPGEES